MFLPISLAFAGAATTAGCKTARASEQDSLSAFKYREVFLPEAVGKNADRLGLNTLDEDWGIWGHNIINILPDDFSESVYAKVNGNTRKQQFCFSSKDLYNYIEEYIDSKFEPDERIRFAIIPNDNEIVCLCEKCVETGNVKGNASPAVTKFVRRLAERFPNHIFYTSDYKTTKDIPHDSMPTNSGVLISAINYPLSVGETQEEQQFISRIKSWKETTPRILVWDYVNNFDDYFTPFPLLGAMQRRLQDYRNSEVTAVFLNGSGSDLSSFSDLHSEVLAALTYNPDTDWRTLLREKARELYPVSGEAIADFLLMQEDLVNRPGVILPWYEGVYKVKDLYLPENEFMDFHDRLINLYPETTGEEKSKLENLLGELTLTRMELYRIKGIPYKSEPYMHHLADLQKKGIPSYNESGWTIEDYLKDYNYLLKHYQETENENKLVGVRLTPLTPLDPDYLDISILTDGVLGMPSNYHNGHLITSPTASTSISVPVVPGAKKLKVWMSYNTGYKIFLPESVTIKGEGLKKDVRNPEYPKDLSGHSAIEFNLPEGLAGPLTLTFYKDPETRSMAIEEIEMF